MQGYKWVCLHLFDKSPKSVFCLPCLLLKRRPENKTCKTHLRCVHAPSNKLPFISKNVTVSLQLPRLHFWSFSTQHPTSSPNAAPTMSYKHDACNIERKPEEEHARDSFKFAQSAQHRLRFFILWCCDICMNTMHEYTTSQISMDNVNVSLWHCGMYMQATRVRKRTYNTEKSTHMHQSSVLDTLTCISIELHTHTDRHPEDNTNTHIHKYLLASTLPLRSPY
jgi:hypothetical protein